MSGNDLGIQGFTADDKPLVAGSRFSVVLPRHAGGVA